ncbi:MAG: valine--tRNA ligase [Christensenellales bacterium]|jgi:valyl-tRNA synthetase
MEKLMDKKYDSAAVEPRLYKKWESRGYFHDKPDKSKKPFSIVIPPPNITGQLHMGHALDNMMQDVLTRFKRMQGHCTLWLPGTDHASIATEVKIVEQMAAENITKKDIGRDGFLKRAWKWKEEYGGRITDQLKRLGSSCDWTRERFTMDEGCSKAVTETFIRLYEKGLIYRGDRIINWCPDCRTALSDAEVEYCEHDGHFWHIKYPVVGSDEYVVIATTRPETMLGDTGVAVHPDDERYVHLIGKKVMLPLMNREIPIVADKYVEKEFGTGAVKMTPSHDPNDFEVGLRQKLEFIRVMDDGGIINENGGKYHGLDRYEARERIVLDLEELSLLIKTEDIKHNVGECYRCGTTVETIISKQWFVSMKPLADPAMAVVRDGTVKFVPERFEKIYFNWMENIRDWCISRQLWWGHRIPAWYCECGETVVSATQPEKCQACGSKSIVQDEDVLDTWFSSGLWPFSTMGWPDKTEELDYFYPTSVLVTGYDIIFFWVARMIVFGMEIMNNRPFDTVFVHGIVRDAQGRKMSKSLGNGIDPLEVIDEYGADALRFSLASGNSPGSDMRFYYEKVESARNFSNKIWNAARFVLMNAGEERPEIDESLLNTADKWLLDGLSKLIKEVTDGLSGFDLGLVAGKLYDFIWSEFCDWYIEMAKPLLYGQDEAAKKNTLAVLIYALEVQLKLLHPFMPFITEEIYSFLPGSQETIMRSSWPKAKYNFAAEAEEMAHIMEAIRSIRNVRAQLNVPPSKRSNVIMVAKKPVLEAFSRCAAYMEKLAYASELDFREHKGDAGEGTVSAITATAELYMPLAGLIDIEAEIKRVGKEADGLRQEIKRAEGKLSNEAFVLKAPEKVVAEERTKLSGYADMLKKAEERLLELKRMSGA